MTENVVEKICSLTGKKNVYFTKRCNESLKIAVNILKQKFPDINKLLIQEEGGWIIYPSLAKKNDLKLEYLKMNSGKLDLLELKKYFDAIVLINTMPGYSYKEDVLEIEKICKKNNLLIINDCCGSIGSIDSTYGDIIVCSFGKAKPLSCGGGGFIATDFDIAKSLELNDEYFVSGAKEIIDMGKLDSAIDNLNKKLSFFKSKAKIIKKELKDLGFDILNKGEQGINVLVPFKNLEEKERLIKYLDNIKLEFTLCPRYIRTNMQALSIEVKRITGENDDA